MEIYSADFLVSNTEPGKCPAPDKPEYAFVGRSNVGKSSLINMLTKRKGLAKTSSTPGKTTLINHFIINNDWYLVDLPGFGYAKTSKTKRKDFEDTVVNYLIKRENLITTFILVDSRIPPQKLDLTMINFMGENNLPFVIILTKTDAVSKRALAAQLHNYQEVLSETWEVLPLFVSTSSKTGKGRNEILDYIDNTNNMFVKPAF